MSLVFAKRVLLSGWNSGWHTPYPVFHYFILLAVQTPYLAMQYMLGGLEGLEMQEGYPFGLSNADSIYMHLAILTRVVSAVMSLGTAFFVYRIGKVLAPNQAAVYGSLLFGLSPAIVFYVHTQTLDVPMVFWLSAAIYCFIQSLRTFRLRYYVALAILAAISTSTKYYAYGAFVLMPIPLVWCLARSQGSAITFRSVWRAIIDRRHLIALVVFLLAFILTENIIWNPVGFQGRMKLISGNSQGPVTITTELGRWDFLSIQRAEQCVRIMPFVLGWIGAPLCLAGVLASIGRRAFRPLLVLLWPLAGLYLFAVVPVLPASSSIERPYIPIAMILAVFGGQLIAGILSRAKESGQRVLQAICIVALVGGALNGLAVDAVLLLDTRYQTERWFAQNVKPGAEVEVFGYRAMAPRLYGSWKSTVVNQDASPDESDLRASSAKELVIGITRRSPDLIVVAEPFSRTWFEGKQATTPEATAFRDFFRHLNANELGYEPVTRVDPILGYLFGMPHQRRLVPAITIYRRAS